LFLLIVQIGLRDTEQFDWYQTFAGVKDIITQFISPESNILNVGCGNSSIIERKPIFKIHQE